MSSKLIEDLCESPSLLREYARKQAEMYPTPEFARKSFTRYRKKGMKRKASTKLDNKRKIKVAKPYDLLGMKEKDALDDSLFSDTSLSKDISIINGNDIETASTTSNHQINKCDLSYSSIGGDYTEVEMGLLRLCALYKLSHPEIKPIIIPKTSSNRKLNEKGVFDEEYRVSKVLRIDYENRPVFEVKWDGYEERTWEPVKNIWDCGAFQQYVANFIQNKKAKMQQLWNELNVTIAAESLEPILSDYEIIEKSKQFNYNDFLAHFMVMVRMQRCDENPQSKNYVRVHEFLLNEMKYLNCFILRLRQLQNMKKFQDNINKEDQSKNLSVENDVDLEIPPMEDFTYTNDVIPRDGIVIDDNPPFGCTCTDDGGQCTYGSKSECCPRINTENPNNFAYTKRGILRVKQGTPIYECNKACKCPETCWNRVVQKGRKQTLSIFKTKERGWGVRTERAIAKGQYICEYVGEIISHEESERRGKEYDAVGRTYLFDLDFNGKDNPYTVDAAKYGNVSRFINHSCNPNLGVWPVWTNCLNPDLHKLCLFTLRAIKENEELSFDYINSTYSGQVQTDDEENDIDIDLLKTENNVNILNLSDSAHAMEVQVQAHAVEVQSDDYAVKKDYCNDIFVQPNNNDEQIESNDQDALDTVIEALPKSTKKEGKEGFTCKCGAPNCRKIIFC